MNGDGTLASATPPVWALALRPHLPALLVEQAHLEQKAAAAATSFLFRVPVRIDLQRELSRLSREELVHFERTLRLLEQRGIPFAKRPPSDYAARLKAAVASTMPQRLLDELLVAALIEARSCERMQCLGESLRGHDDELATFYLDLVAAEARHRVVYVDIALALVDPATGLGMDPAAVAQRWRLLAAHEASVLGSLPWSPHLHGGLPTEPQVADHG